MCSRFRSGQVVVLVAVAIVGMTVSAASAKTRPGSPSRSFTAARSCPRGAKRAIVAGKLKCLRAGQRCSMRYQSAYKKYGFHCAAGRLRKGTGASVTPPPAPPPPASPPPDRVFGNGVRSGSDTLGQVSFAFDAQASGTVSGHYQHKSQTTQAEIDVKCLVVAGKKAVVGGVVQQAQSSSGIGPGALFVVWMQDNSPASADQMSASFFFGQEELAAPGGFFQLPPDFPATCPAADLPSGLAFLPVISGDLTVVDQP